MAARRKAAATTAEVKKTVTPAAEEKAEALTKEADAKMELVPETAAEIAAPKTPVKKAPAKKAPARKAPARKAPAAEEKAEALTAEAPTGEIPAAEAPAAAPAALKEIKAAVYVQYAGREVAAQDLLAAAKEAYIAAGHKEDDIETIDVYVKPEENAAYFAVNGEGSDDFKIEY